AVQAPLSQLPPHIAAFTSSATANGVLGRDAELAKMRGWLQRALAGERQTVFITGEPGIGKTTIVQAFLEQATQVPGVRVARGQDPARLVVIGTYRPVDVIVGDHPLKGVKRELQAHGLCHELPLEYLSEEAVGKYLTARFPGHEFPLRLRRTIYRRTEGNPLFMVNLVEYLTDQKMIIATKGAWELR